MNFLKPNVGTTDRIIRIIVSGTSFTAGYFWLSGTSQIIAYVVGFASLVTGLIAYCGAYTLCKKSTCATSPAKTVSNRMTGLLIILFIILLAIESAGSMMVTRKKFLEAFNHMNGFYKQTLFLTGQSKRDEAKIQYDQLVAAYAEFSVTYAVYRPYVVRGDLRFTQDLQSVQEIISSVKDGVYAGDLGQTHKKLEEVRPIFQELFKRNGFSMESMALVDFHDIMEALIASADLKDAQGVLSGYVIASDSLKIVEKEDTSEGIRKIRTALETLKQDAEKQNVDALKGDAAELKKQFIAVYLLKG